MTITFDTATAHIQHTLGGELSQDIDTLSVINDAGSYMTSMYPWRWLEEAATLAALTSGSSTALPTGFVELVGYTPRGMDSRVTGSQAFLVSPQELEDMRNSSQTLPLDTAYIAIVYTTTSGTTIPTPVLDVYGNGTLPTIKIRYRKNWTQITTSAGTGSLFAVPEWTEALYIQVLRAFARGLEEEDVGSLNARLGEIQAGPQFAAAVSRDSLIESTTLRTYARPTPVSPAT